MAQQYRPVFKLDSGGMAEVYVAEAVSLEGFKKKVAMKRILPGLLRNERFVRMFLDEARLSMQLNHANVVSVFDIGKTDNTYFIVMEYVEGTNLKSLLEWQSRRGQILPIATTVWIINEILVGLAYAHGLTDPETGKRFGIIHRDISPPNILISWNGEVKLTDFGLAKATTQLESTEPGVVKGKFAYLSPEAANAQPIDQRTDIFAVGILLFEMLSGRRLFLGENDWQTIENVRAARAPDLRALNPEVTDALQAIVNKALARHPAERYSAASDFADDLVTVMWSMRPNRRELIELLAELKNDAPARGQVANTPRASNLILNLLGDELAHFESLEDSASEREPAPSQSLMSGILEPDELEPTYDPSQPLSPDFSYDSPSDSHSGNAAGNGPASGSSAQLRRSDILNDAGPAESAARRDRVRPATPTMHHESPAAANLPPPRTRVEPSPAPRETTHSGRMIALFAILLLLSGAAVVLLIGR
jgi:serine/threonine-protein kinase